MRVLIVKTSSMGDIIHTLPALTDAAQALPAVRFDWVVEQQFAEIPAWHSQVDRVIPVAIRTWRRRLFSRQTWRAMRDFYALIRSHHYDYVIDAQGLLKSALIAACAHGKRAGLDRTSARESLAAFFYQDAFPIAKKQHAIARVRGLFAAALGYAMPNTMPDYGIDRQRFVSVTNDSAYLVFLHGTTWQTKLWPESYWIALAELAGKNQFRVKITYGNAEEQARAERLAAGSAFIEVLPKQTLADMACILAGARGVVGLDTGLGHLAAALSVPAISLYGPTSPGLTGALGRSQLSLSATFPACAPCFGRTCTYEGVAGARTSAGRLIMPPCLASLTPESVWAALQNKL